MEKTFGVYQVGFSVDILSKNFGPSRFPDETEAKAKVWVYPVPQVLPSSPPQSPNSSLFLKEEVIIISNLILRKCTNCS